MRKHSTGQFGLTGLGILTAVMVSVMVGCQKKLDVVSSKPTIVLVAFGTSVPEARKVFDCIDATARKRYPGADIRWAFTSAFIRKKLKARGVVTQSIEEVVADLRANGCTIAVFQSLHVVPGQEFSEIGKVDTDGLKIAVGKALLTTDADIAAVIAAVGRDIDPGAANVIAAHGNNRHPEFNAQIVAFAKAIEAVHENVFVCSVEGQPGMDGLKAARRLAATRGKVNFIPLMVVAGDHILNDVCGDKADSWKTIVAAGTSTCAKPLGYNDAVLDVYFDHIDEAMAKMKE